MKINYGTLEKDFVETRLIAYIGNKRRLIRLLIKALEYCDIDNTNPDKIPTFFDPFTGTGVVSRLSKTQGFKIVSNDWEYYSYVINKLYIEMDDKLIDKVFEQFGGIKNVIDHLNQLSPLPYDESYITKYYCPKDTNNPDISKERMFYKRETGEKIDAIRGEIDKLATRSKNNGKHVLYTLLSPLLYEASARSNTSGVFKAYHRGFGGSQGDALSRILRDLTIEKPILWDNITKHKVFKTDAIKLCKRLNKLMKFDIAYLDPPYNQHQYGSNYHLLNTIAYNDKPPINKEIYINGKKTNKSGIRKDWIKTKSGFCYKSSARLEFKELIRYVNAKYILVSYSIDGIIDFDDMLDILIEKGSLDIITSQYVKYPGGKQSLKREVNNIEFVLIVNTELEGKKSDKKKIYSKLVDEKIPLYHSKTVSVNILHKNGFVQYSDYEFIKGYRKFYDGYRIEIDIYNEYSFYEEGGTMRVYSPNDKKMKLDELPLEIKERYLQDLKTACDLTKEDELNMVLSVIKKNMNKGYYDVVYKFMRRIPYLLNKFNNKKAYEASLNMIIKIADTFKNIKISKLETKKIQTTLKKFNRIVSTKLKHQLNLDKSEEMSKIVNLKKSVKKEYYENIAKRFQLSL